MEDNITTGPGIIEPGIIEPPPGVHRFPCEVCNGQYLSTAVQRSGTATYEESFTDTDAQEKINELVLAISEVQEGLKIGLEQFGDLVLTRWTKKTKVKREQALGATTLVKAWGSEPLASSPLDAWLHYNGKVWSCGRWLCVKPFAEDRTRLLSLLHLRSTHESSKFALLDIKELRLAFGTGWDGSTAHFYNSKCMKLCGPEYGRLIEWDQQLAHSWAIAGFPRAFLMLVAQKEIMQFCMEMMMNIINGAEPVGNEKWKSHVAAGFKAPGSETIWSCYTNPAFAPPVVFDPEYLLHKATSRLKFALDDIWLMQTDPAYMHYIVRSRKASIVYDATATPSAAQRWSKLAHDFMKEAYQRLGFWNVVVIGCKNVCRTLKATGFKRGQRVSEEADKAMYVLSSELHGRLRLLSHHLEGLLPTMSVMRSRFTAYQEGSNVRYRESKDMDPNIGPDRLIMAISSLQHAVQQMPGTYYLSMAFDMLERELLSLPHAYCVDQRLLEYLNDMAAMDEMFALVSYNQIGNAEMPEKQRSWEENHRHHINRYNENALRINPNTADRLGVLLKSFYEAPWPKGKQDLTWFEKATKSRKKLAAFWEVYRKELKAGEEASKMDPTRSALDLIKFDTAPEFLAELETERHKCEAQSAADAAASAAKADRMMNMPAENLQSALSSSSDQALPVRRKKTKAKAVRQALELNTDSSAFEEDATSPSSADDQNDHVAPIAVKQDNLSVFSKMYPTTGSDAGSVRWQQFVQAMIDAGFTATSNSGSAVSFSNDHGSISVHRPHPEPTIDPAVLQGIGKRMRKWFGWTSGSFVLRQKEVETM